MKKIQRYLIKVKKLFRIRIKDGEVCLYFYKILVQKYFRFKHVRYILQSKAIFIDAIELFEIVALEKFQRRDMKRMKVISRHLPSEISGTVL